MSKKKTIITVVGARPQFIKAAVVSRALRPMFNEIIVHTGQHYDYMMSEVFFKELDIPKPDYNLGISGGGHADMTARMLVEIAHLLEKIQPDAMLVYGDTNSTLAAALAAVKLHVPIVHVEAGNRLGTLDNPEEVNRILTDHISSLRLACTESALEFLCKEGLEESSYLVGDPMYDAFVYYSKKVGDRVPEELIPLCGGSQNLPDRFNYMTCHREENTKDPDTLKEILAALEARDCPCIYPVHPRNHKMVLQILEENKYEKVIFVQPVGYLMSVYLLNHCEQVVTDSGGLQREAFFAKKQCVTVFDHVVWPETMQGRRNQLAQPIAGDIIEKLDAKQQISEVSPFGDGNASEKISTAIKVFLESKE